MLFAIWRAMQDMDPNSAARSRDSGNLKTIPQQDNLEMSSPATGQDVINEDKHATDMMPPKIEVDEALRERQFEDARPAVFTSTFWEVCAIASLVCGQLTNVFPFPSLNNEYLWVRNLRILNKLLFLP